MIHTPRLQVRRLEPADLPAFSELFADEDALKYYGDGVALSSQEAAEKLTFFSRHWDEHGFSLGAIVRKDSEEVVGFGGLALSWWGATPEVFLSFLIARAMWGQGFATELAEHAVRYGFVELGLQRITATVHPANTRALRVVERAGMRRTGYAEDIQRYHYEVCQQTAPAN